MHSGMSRRSPLFNMVAPAQRAKLVREWADEAKRARTEGAKAVEDAQVAPKPKPKKAANPNPKATAKK